MSGKSFKEEHPPGTSVFTNETLMTSRFHGDFFFKFELRI